MHRAMHRSRHARRALRLGSALSIAAVIAAGLVASALAVTAPAPASAVQVTSCPAPITLTNGSFEAPGVADGAGRDVDSSTDSQISWKTTESDHDIELWHANSSASVSGQNWNIPLVPEDGLQFAELNAHVAGALYQDIATVPGQTMVWSLWHRARGASPVGNDVMKVYIGSAAISSPTLSDVTTNLPAQVPDQATTPGDANITDGPYAWGQYTGTYVVPAGQTMTRFAFAAVSTASGDQSVGNFLDNVHFSNAPCLPATKTVQNLTTASGGLVRPGDTLRYTVSSTNGGGGTATNTTLTDPIPTGTTYVPGSLSVDSVAATDASGDDLGEYTSGQVVGRVGVGANTSTGGTLARGASTTMSFNVTVNAGDAAGTVLNNMGHTSYYWAAGQSETDGDTNAVASTVSTTGLTVSKHAVSTSDVNGDGVLAAGDTIHYSFVVTNSGSTSLSAVSVNDPAVTVSCPGSTLAAGASETCTGTYTVTQADADAGVVSGPATAVGTPPLSAASITAAPSTATTTLDLAAGLTVTNTPDHNTVSAVGDPVAYTAVATNSGTVTLTGVTVPGSTSCSPATPATLAPGAQLTCVMPAHTTTQADLDHGSIANAATATGTAPGNHPVTGIGTATVTSTQHPALSAVQTTTRTALDAVGQSVPYSVVVTNTGNVTLTHVIPTDLRALPGGGAITLHCPTSTTLAPGASLTCTGTTDATQADLDAGRVTATASATATAPDGTAVIVAHTSVVTVPVTASPALAVKVIPAISDTSGNDRLGFGDNVSWVYLVTNTGNVGITNPVVHDSAAGAVVCPQLVLLPGAQMECTSRAPHTINASDITAGVVQSSAVASGTAACVTASTCTAPVSAPASGNVPLSAVNAIKLVQTATVQRNHSGSATLAGDLVTWHMTVTNTGDVPLHSILVTTVGGVTVHCKASSLVQGASTTCTAGPTVVTAAQAKSGVLSNTATATSSTGAITVISAPALASVVLTAHVASSAAGSGGGVLAETGAQGVSTAVLWMIVLFAAGIVAIGIARVRRLAQIRRRG